MKLQVGKRNSALDYPMFSNGEVTPLTDKAFKEPLNKFPLPDTLPEGEGVSRT
jgi:hypothetical protein